ncbi:MAG: V-type ATP synthase subunit I [Synergistales bacterium]|nr:V-type ATP synthase subunit I [Synergistales bacterium]
MAIAKVKKVRIIAHRDARDDIIGILQDMRSCELISEQEQGGKKKQAGGMDSDALQHLENELTDLRFALRFLESHYDDPENAMERLLGAKDSYSLEELKDLKDAADFASLSKESRTLERRLSQINTERGQIASLLETLSSIRSFPYELSLLTTGTERVRGVVGTIPAAQAEQFEAVIEENLDTMGECRRFAPEEKDAPPVVAILYETEKAQKIEELLGQYPFSKVDLPQSLSGFVGDEEARLHDREEALQQERLELEERAAALADEWVPECRKAVDYLGVLRDRGEALNKAGRTERTVAYTLWCPADRLEELEAAVSALDLPTDLSSTDPEPDEDPPALLRLPAYARPCEVLTKLYGAPHYHAMDPTVPMAPFFILFFGMCLSDAGYGVVITGLILLLIYKYRMEGETRRFFNLFLFGGVSTIAVGILCGSWLGNLFAAFPFLSFFQPVVEGISLINPMEDPITYLLIALALGFVQVLYGLGLAFRDNWKQGDRIAAIGDQGGWGLILIGILLIALGSQGVGASFSLLGKLCAAFGAGLLVATQGREKPTLLGKAMTGLLSLYNVTSYISDILSYSRLLALGMATGAIAMIVNMLVTLIGDVPYVGWLIGLFVFLIGHTFSIAVNVLGAFIHSLRLQYVEFFSKFYSAGGRFMEPFEYNTKYINIKHNKT